MKKILLVSCELDILEKIKSLKKEYNIASYEFVFLIEDFTVSGEIIESHNIYVIKDFAIHTDVALVVEKILALHQINEVISNDEFSLFVSAYARERLKLPGLKCEDARKFRDKQLMKIIASHHKISTPEEFHLSDVLQQKVKLPVVLKPRSLAGAVGVSVIYNLSELPAELKGVSDNYRDMDAGQFLIEEYNSQDIFHIDCVVLYGKIVFISVGAYQGSPLDYLKGKVLGGISVPHNEVQSMWLPFTEKLKSAFTFPDGVYHVEAFEGIEEPSLLEIAFRPGGGPITDAILHTYGIDLRLIHLAAQLGVVSKLVCTDKDIGYAYLLYPKDHLSLVPKKVTHVSTPNLKELTSLKVFKIAQIDEIASGEFYNHKDCLGMFIFSGKPSLINREYKKVIENYNVTLGVKQ
ncbi:serine kinase [Brenneria rubrifaciens]|uniref:Serine kinase n=2 Tax=Brenneria rubrifaciens TaxID=55213 RepID=A0A4P8QT20_9GAMM|nr:serine kinase [Brenneria rubrifaciens]